MAFRRPRRLYLLIAAITLVAVTGLVLLVLFLPVQQESSGYTMVGPRLYSYESEELFGANSGWENYSYRGVTFGFHLWCETTPAAGTLCGNATGSDGVAHSYSFSDGSPQIGPPSWEIWVSPNGHEAVEYQQGGLVHLLVVA